MTRHFSPADCAELLDPARQFQEAEMAILECEAKVRTALAGRHPDDTRDTLLGLESALDAVRFEIEQHLAIVRSTHAMRDEDDRETLDNVWALLRPAEAKR